MYAQKLFKDRLASFDVYKTLPKGYLRPTCIGAICKILNILWIINLIIIIEKQHKIIFLLK